MKTGDLVRVIDQIDLHIYRGDRKAEKEFRALHYQTGRIIGFDNLECGASPKDPMVRVQFRGGKVDAFWTEELKVL
jgi:hypothetical protein